MPTKKRTKKRPTDPYQLLQEYGQGFRLTDFGYYHLGRFQGLKELNETVIFTTLGGQSLSIPPDQFQEF